MSDCKRIQHRLAAEGPVALREDGYAQEHLVHCEACYRFLENLLNVLGQSIPGSSPRT